jgi:hypothetical protein
MDEWTYNKDANSIIHITVSSTRIEISHRHIYKSIYRPFLERNATVS